MSLAYQKSYIGQHPDLLIRMLAFLEKSKDFLTSGSGDIASDGLAEQQLTALRCWHLNRMRVTHNRLLSQAGYGEAAEFILKDVYAGFGLNISNIAAQIERTLPIAMKIFPINVLETAATALELNVITHEIDEALSSVLFVNSTGCEVWSEDYLAAYLEAGIHQVRVQQLELSRKLAASVDQYLNKKWLFHAFKLARMPARKAGILDLYEFLDQAFDVLANIPNLSQVVCEIAQLEHGLSQQLSQGENPFKNEQYRLFLQSCEVEFQAI